MTRFVQWDDPPRPASVERALAFVDYVEKVARTGNRRGALM
jgi:hypothetical protein